MVSHPYGGVVVTEAGTYDKVSSLSRRGAVETWAVDLQIAKEGPGRLVGPFHQDFRWS